MTQEDKIITVIGGTGKQGGSVARSLLQNPNFRVRCITRDPNSKQAHHLRDLGAEIVQGNGYDETEMETLLRGSWGIFINNGYELSDAVRQGDYDRDFGNCILRGASKAAVPHVVFSSQPSAEDLTNGLIRTPVIDVKAHGEKWARSHGQFKSFTPIMSSWYMEDFLMPSFATDFGGFPLHTDNDGYLTLRSAPLGGREEVPWICVDEDFGDLVHGIFLNPMRWNQRMVQAVGEIMSFGDVVGVFADVTNRSVRFIPYEKIADIPDDGRVGLQESGDVFAFYQLREGELFGSAATESHTAAYLKQASFRAKGGQGREVLTTCREWFERHFAGDDAPI